MKYKLKSTFKSLEPFETEELLNFVILTGINGVGKTQILQALQNGHSNIVIDGILIPPHKIKYIEKLLPVNDLSPLHTRDYNDYQPYHEDNPLFLGYCNFFEFQNQNHRLPENFEELEKFINSIYGNINLTIKQFQKLKSFIEQFPERIIDPKLFKESIPQGYHPTIHDIFSQNFSTIFYNYQKIEFENLFNEFLKEYKKKDVSYLNQTDFIKKYGDAPWKVINAILDSIHMPYEFKVPPEDDYNRSLTYEPKFIKKDSGKEIKISDLSSGEKILISLAFALYNNDHVTQLPTVLLLDETDASLHPQMSKQYLYILKNIFVKDLGIKVIITTHSPSTVAFADESDIYVVENTPVPIRKCSKDEALSVLTAGVPSFSVNYENRKQVFVESHYDAEFYNEIYTLLRSYLDPEISLSFISCGDIQKDKNYDAITGCAQVKKVTQLMREAGNKSCYGLIDWDNCNKEDKGIFVNALNEQYSIENCLLNPLFIALLLILKEIHPFEIFSTSLRTFDPNNQSIIDHLTNKLLDLMNFNDSDVLNINLANGRTTTVPKTYLHYQGHDLEDRILKVVPALNSLRKGNEPSKRVKLAIIQTVFRNYPELIPQCFIDVFRKIQKSS
ncbi:ATP-binding protein [Acinetobacter pittii]|uniref:ATP-binding protein n=1 Tax=Acinetobacter pittii TaxID=48296 RepID=UPI002AFF3B23|nr:ATP-binding protein [Acinetobacter pittii]